MSAEMQAAIIGAIVGGVTGYAAAFLQAWQERRRRRQALASVLLLELRGVEHLLRSFFKQPDNLTGDFQADHFDRLDATVFELDGEAARMALSFKHRLDEIRILRSRQGEKLSGKRRDTLSVKLYAALCEVSKLKDALLGSRGLEPPQEDYKEVGARDLVAPPKAFDYGPPDVADEG